MNSFDRYTESLSDIAIKAAPPATVSSATFFDVYVPYVLQIATLIYIFLVIADKGWSMWRRWKGYKDNERTK